MERLGIAVCKVQEEKFKDVGRKRIGMSSLQEDLQGLVDPAHPHKDKTRVSCSVVIVRGINLRVRHR